MESSAPDTSPTTVPGLLRRALTRERLQRWPRLLAKFVSGQAALQAVTMVTGFLVLRWLSDGSKVPYAQYALAISVQATLAGVIELGFPGAVAALVGARKDDPQLVGAYVRAAQHLRDTLLLIATPVGVGVLVALGLHQGWPLAVLLSMAAGVATMVYFQGQTVFPSMALHMHRDMRGTYAGQIRWSAMRLAVLAGVFALGAMSVHWALWTTVAATLLVCVEMRRRAAGLMAVPREVDGARRRELIAFLAPLVPTHLFGVLQPQIIVLLASIFGASATIAEVGALGRLGQLFVVVHMFHAILVFHYFAGMAPERVARNYAAAVLGSVAYLTVIAIVGFQVPGVFLWLLGASYGHLGAEVGWIVLASCFLCLQHLLWTIHFARRWVFWWFTWANIGLCLGAQVACLALIDVSTTHGAVMFSLWSSLVLLIAQMVLATSQLFRRPGGTNPVE